MVVGDFAERDGLRRALAGIEVAFLALGSSLQQVELEQHFIDVAAEVGLPHLVKLSAADARSDSVASVLRWHAAIESHLATSGVPHTRSVRQRSLMYSCWPGRRYARLADGQGARRTAATR
jgi:uncharacterized protein YbjT (DUF2867 family)